MKKFLLLPLLLLLSRQLAAGDLEIIRDGKSSYKIIYADHEPYPHHKHFNAQAASTLQKILRHATGAALPVVPESSFDGKSKAIFIGATSALRKAALAPASYKRWEHRIDIKNGNIYLHGMDWRNKRAGKYPSRNYHVLGSYKAMLTFTEKFLNAVYAGTPNFCDGIPKTSRVAVPDNYSWKSAPAIEYNMTARRTLEYDVANNGFYAPWYGSYGGHNHNVALKQSKYLKSHPEYYALMKGKRNPGPRTQICLSNKNVQELIYKEVLDHIDQGYDMVQLAQSDGFLPCECDNCRDLFGLKPEAPASNQAAYRKSAVWGEKLWILHRNFALRLLKDRPGKKVCVIAYGPTRRPPQTFKNFPDNVVIELAPYSEEILKSWASHKVPGGFVVYLYNWGYYNDAGFMPKRSWSFLKKQVISMLKSNVKGIYCCGFGEAHGLEGPNYYIWLKLLADPDQDEKVLLKRFCTAIFPKAAKEMEEFYTLINSRLDLNYTAKETDWNDPALLNGKYPSNDRPATGLIRVRWTEEVMQKLDSILKKAEAKSGRNWQLSLARWELDYLMLTARSVNALAKFRKTRSESDYKIAEKYLIQRQDFIAAAKWKNDRAYKDGFPLFAYASPAAAQAGGRLRGLLFAPFNWDVRWMKSKNIQFAARRIKVGDTNAQYLIIGNYLTDMLPVHKEKAVRLYCRREGNDLKVVFIKSGTTYKEMERNVISVILGPDSQNLSRFTCRFRTGRVSRYIKTKDNSANKGLGDIYGKHTGQPGKVVVPAPGVKLAPGEISAEMTIPLSVFGKVPVPGAEWCFSATAEHQLPGMNLYTVWEYNFDQATWRNTRDRQGKILF